MNKLNIKRTGRKKEIKQIIELEKIDLSVMRKLFEVSYAETIKEIKKANWGKGDNKPTYLATYRRYIGLFDRLAYISFIDYFVEKHGMRQSSFSFRTFIKENYYKKEKMNTGVLSEKLETNINKNDPLLKLTDEAMYAIADIREKFVEPLYEFIFKETGCIKPYSVATEKISY